MNGAQFLEGKWIGTKSTAEPYDDDSELMHRINAIEGSLRLRDAIFRARGYEIPKRPAPKLPRYRRQRRRGPGRPASARKVRKTDWRIVRIIAASARYHRVKPEDVVGHCRKARFVVPRQIAMYIARRTTPASLLDIGHHFSGRDHTTILHAIAEVEKRIAAIDHKTLESLSVINRALAK